jgi:hypothetical protein
MTTHTAQIKWGAKESGEEFLKGRFSRAHRISFDGGACVGFAACRRQMGGRGRRRSRGNARRGSLALHLDDLIDSLPALLSYRYALIDAPRKLPR